jgi:hypothetical protein
VLVVAAVQLLLVALAPSRPTAPPSGAFSALGGTNAPGSAFAPGGGAAVGGPGAAGIPAGPGGAGPVTAGAPGTGVRASTGTGSSVGGIAGATSGDFSRCQPNGKEIGPTFYMPKCVAVWHGGDNGGATMPGVTATRIGYVYFNLAGNAQVDAILSEEGLTSTNQQTCAAIQAFTAELNKRWEMYGRRLVGIDGPAAGNHKGSVQQSGCSFPYFQSQCTTSPPDLPCFNAEAQLIANLHPAFVLAPQAPDAIYEGVARQGLLVLSGAATYDLIPESYFEQLAPSFYNVFPSATQTMQQVAEYYCKKLSDRAVQFAGPEVEALNGPASPPPLRRVGIIYPINNGDPVVKISADYLAHLLSGGECGRSGNGTEEFAYASDINTAQQQSSTVVAGIKHDHITTVICLCDPIGPVFLTTTLEQQNYHPEVLIPGSGLLDYDVLAQLYNADVWRHAFGPSEIDNQPPTGQDDATKAYNDAGYSGQPDATEELNWEYFSVMGAAIQDAGPGLTPASVRRGLSAAPPEGGTPAQWLESFTGAFPWTGIKDFREVWYCPTAVSRINGKPGAYVPVDGGRRMRLGQVPPGTAELFPSGPCAP